jgi:hypothetical protein
MAPSTRTRQPKADKAAPSAPSAAPTPTKQHGAAQDEVYSSERLAALMASGEAQPGWSRTVWVHYSDLKPWAVNPRLHTGEQPAEIAEMIRAVGFVDPVVIWVSKGELRAGHGRLAAMRLLCETGYRAKTIKGKKVQRPADPGFTPPGAPGPGMVRALLIEFESEAHANAYAIAADKLSAKATVDASLERLVKRGLLADKAFEASVHVAGIEAADLDMLRDLADAEAEINLTGADDYDVLSTMMGDDEGQERAASKQADEAQNAADTQQGERPRAELELTSPGEPQAQGAAEATAPTQRPTKVQEPAAPPQPVLVDLVIPMTPSQRSEVERTLRRVREEEGLEGNVAALLCVMRAHFDEADLDELPEGEE